MDWHRLQDSARRACFAELCRLCHSRRNSIDIGCRIPLEDPDLPLICGKKTAVAKPSKSRLPQPSRFRSAPQGCENASRTTNNISLRHWHLTRVSVKEPLFCHNKHSYKNPQIIWKLIVAYFSPMCYSTHRTDISELYLGSFDWYIKVSERREHCADNCPRHRSNNDLNQKLTHGWWWYEY